MVDHAASPRRLRRIGEALARLDLGGLGLHAEAVRRRAQVAASDYLVPRLDAADDPIVVAVVGPTGGGKSTIVNALAHRLISDAGPLRPTTTEPVAWAGQSLPGTLDGLRTRLRGSVVDTLRPPPAGAVIVDTPPPEVVDDGGVSIVRHVLDVADAVVFVAGASRYADVAGFDLLELAAVRRLPTVMVLNRLPGDPVAQQTIAGDFAAKLTERGLIPRADASLVTTIPEAALDPDADGIDPTLVAGVAKDIEAMADPQARPAIVSGVVVASLRRLRDDLEELRRLVIDATVRRVELLDPVRAAYRREAGRLVGDIRQGRFADVPDDRIGSVLASATARRAGIAARTSAEAWAGIAPDLIDSAPELYAHDPGTPGAALDRFAFWLSELDGLPAVHGARQRGPRGRRRVAAELARCVLDPDAVPSRRVRRLMRRRTGILAAARELLVDEIDGVVATDAQRFVDRVGPAPPEGVLGVLGGVDDE